MSITFAVDDVKRADAAERECPLGELFAKFAQDQPLFCTDASMPVLAETPYNPLISAAHRAFAQHRPLVLSPDIIWLTIAQGLAIHINVHAEQFRDQLVDHKGRKEIHVAVDSLASEKDWMSVIGALCDGVSDDMKADLHAIIRCDFSTSTATSRAVGDLVLLDAMQRFYVYSSAVICGIPEVTLLGTPDDWRSIEERVEKLAEYDLQWWLEWLRPVCRQLRLTAEGHIDKDFWQCIYIPEEAYGADHVITGWICRLFPYVDDLYGADMMEDADALEEKITALEQSGKLLDKLRRAIIIAPFVAKRVFVFATELVTVLADENNRAEIPPLMRPLMPICRWIRPHLAKWFIRQPGYARNQALAPWDPSQGWGSFVEEVVDEEEEQIDEARAQWMCRGTVPDFLPIGLSQVPVQIELANGKREKVVLVGGLIGVQQYPDTLALQPNIGWGVVRGSERISHLFGRGENF